MLSTARVVLPSITLFAFLSAWGSNPALGQSEKTIVGEFAIVDLRVSSAVESALGFDQAENWLGSTVKFGQTLEWGNFGRCKAWEEAELEDAILPLTDPNLSDINLPPLDGKAPAIEENSKSFKINCTGKEGVFPSEFLKIDERVLIAWSPSGRYYVILERPLTEPQVQRLQIKLKDMKFYAGPATGILDEKTLSAISFYADYRGAKYTFLRPTITESLLDKLSVIEGNE